MLIPDVVDDSFTGLRNIGLFSLLLLTLSIDVEGGVMVVVKRGAPNPENGVFF